MTDQTPELWWSPSKRAVYQHLPLAGYWLISSEEEQERRLLALPSDAVRLVPETEEARKDAEIARLRGEVHDLTRWKEDMLDELTQLDDRAFAKAGRECKRQRDEARRELASIADWCKERAKDLATFGRPTAGSHALWDVIDEIRRRKDKAEHEAWKTLSRPAASEGTCNAWGGCDLPRGHNMGQVDIPANHHARPDATEGTKNGVCTRCGSGVLTDTGEHIRTDLPPCGGQDTEDQL